MNSIRRQLTRNLFGAFLVLLTAGVAGLYFAAREATTDQFDDALSAKALAISTLTFQTSEGMRTDFTDRFLRGFDDNRPRDFFQLWDEAGQEIARSESLAAGQDLPRRLGNVDRPVRWNFLLPNGRPGRAQGFVFQPKSTDSRRTASASRQVQLVVASDRGELDEILQNLLGLCVGWGVLLLGATWWIVPRVLRRGLRPLDELGEQAARIDAESLGSRFTEGQLPAELLPIAGQLNGLVARLEQSFERERRFSADLAHELRTPLAELRSIAECALKWPESREPSVDADTLAIARQMEQLVIHLLALNRGEQGQLAVKLEPVALAPMVKGVWQRFENRARERELRVRLNLASEELPADVALLKAILTNLFENAVDYAAPAGEVSLAITREAGHVVVTVSNSTADLRPDDVPQLFDRFWRKEAARTGGVHLGLGLSLSRAFARAMGWSLTAAMGQNREIVFRLTAPVSHSVGPRLVVV